MKIPRMPITGDYVLPFAKAVIEWMRANTVVNVSGGSVKRSANGVTIEIPQANNVDTKPFVAFKLTTKTEGESVFWRVSSRLSHVINGLNGPVFDLTDGGADWKDGGITFNEDTEFTENQVIVLQCAVDPDTLACTDFELVAVAEDSLNDALPIGIDEDSMSGTFGKQLFSRRRIGRVIYNGDTDPPSGHALQSTFIPQLMTFALFNGNAVVKMIDDEIHPDDMVDGSY